jgi:hypothetical protein
MATGARIWAGFAAAFWAIGFFGIYDLAIVVGPAEEVVDLVGLEASWGVLFTLIIGGAFLAIAASPASPWPALVLLFMVSTALLLAAAYSYDAGPLVLALILTPMTLVLFGLSRGQWPPLPRQQRSPSLPLLVLACASALLWWSYATEALAAAQIPEIRDDVVWGFSHWPVQGALGLVMVFAVLVMAFWPASRPLFGGSCGLSSMVLGGAWLAYPDSVGAVDSAPLAWGAVLWGLAVMIVGIRTRVSPAA